MTNADAISSLAVFIYLADACTFLADAATSALVLTSFPPSDTIYASSAMSAQSFVGFRSYDAPKDMLTLVYYQARNLMGFIFPLFITQMCKSLTGVDSIFLAQLIYIVMSQITILATPGQPSC